MNMQTYETTHWINPVKIDVLMKWERGLAYHTRNNKIEAIECAMRTLEPGYSPPQSARYSQELNSGLSVSFQCVLGAVIPVEKMGENSGCF